MPLWWTSQVSASEPLSERWFQLQTHLSLLTFQQDIKPKTSSSDYRACILPVLWTSQNGYRLRLLLGCVATLHDIFNLFTHSPSLTCVQHVLSALLSFTTLDSLSSTVFMSFVSACLLSHFLMSCCKSTDKLSNRRWLSCREARREEERSNEVQWKNQIILREINTFVDAHQFHSINNIIAAEAETDRFQKKKRHHRSHCIMFRR